MSQEKTKTVVSTQVRNDILILKVKGRLDAVCAAEIDRFVTGWIDKGMKYLVINFQDVPYLSSAGLRLLLLTTIKLKSCKGRMVVCALSEEVKYVIRITGFDSVFNIYSTEDEALSRVSEVGARVR